MLKRSSLQRKEFKHEELALMKKLDFNDIEIIKSDNLVQLLIWTSELAQYNHAQFIEFSNKLDHVDELEEREEVSKKITFYRKSAFSENQIKDFIKPFKEQYKKITSKNREIKEHNAVVHEIYIKIKNKEATLHKEMVKKSEKPIPVAIEKDAISVKVKDIPVLQDIAKKEKLVTVIKKRKFALIKDK